MHKENYDLTNDAVSDFFRRVDDYCLTEGNDISQLLMSLKEYEQTLQNAQEVKIIGGNVTYI